eukprot:3361222-Rhodomonas_salina.1
MTVPRKARSVPQKGGTEKGVSLWYGENSTGARDSTVLGKQYSEAYELVHVVVLRGVFWL